MFILLVLFFWFRYSNAAWAALLDLDIGTNVDVNSAAECRGARVPQWTDCQQINLAGFASCLDQEPWYLNACFFRITPFRVIAKAKDEAAEMSLVYLIPFYCVLGGPIISPFAWVVVLALMQAA